MIILKRNHFEVSHVDARRLSPQFLSGLSIDEIHSVDLDLGRTTISVAELFDVSRKPHAGEESNCESLETVLIDGDCSTMSHLGASQRLGTLIVRGNTGDYLGERMSGGRILVLGNGGDCAAQSMSGGFLFVNGDCGDRLAGPSPGKATGMRGGDVVVTGSCGVRVAERMRRGTLFIGGSAGEFGCARMIAGTVVCLGTVGSSWCQGMQRGTVIALHDLEDLSLCKFSSPRDFELSFLPLIWKHLSRSVEEVIAYIDALELGAPIRKNLIPTTRWVKRRIGDIEHRGAGEILILQRITSELSQLDKKEKKEVLSEGDKLVDRT